MLNKYSDAIVHGALAPPELAMLAVARSATGPAVQDAPLVFVHPSIEGHCIANVSHRKVEYKRNKGTWAVARVVYGRISCLSVGLLRTDETGQACSSHSMPNVGGIVSFVVSPIRRRTERPSPVKARLIHHRNEASCGVHSELAS